MVSGELSMQHETQIIFRPVRIVRTDAADDGRPHEGLPSREGDVSNTCIRKFSYGLFRLLSVKFIRRSDVCGFVAVNTAEVASPCQIPDDQERRKACKWFADSIPRYSFKDRG